jgi:hypothetical protein
MLIYSKQEILAICALFGKSRVTVQFIFARIWKPTLIAKYEI